MADLLAKLKHARSRLAGEAVTDIPTPFEVRCDCGSRLAGIRRTSWQRLRCQACSIESFALPANMYPRTKRVHSEVIGGSLPHRLITILTELLDTPRSVPPVLPPSPAAPSPAALSPNAPGQPPAPTPQRRRQRGVSPLDPVAGYDIREPGASRTAGDRPILDDLPAPINHYEELNFLDTAELVAEDETADTADSYYDQQVLDEVDFLDTDDGMSNPDSEVEEVDPADFIDTPPNRPVTPGSRSNADIAPHNPRQRPLPPEGKPESPPTPKNRASRQSRPPEDVVLNPDRRNPVSGQRPMNPAGGRTSASPPPPRRIHESPDAANSSRPRRQDATSVPVAAGAGSSSVSDTRSDRDRIAARPKPLRLSDRRRSRRLITPFRLILVSVVAVTSLTGWWVVRSNRLATARITLRSSLDDVETALKESDMAALEQALEAASSASETLGHRDAETQHIQNLKRQTVAVNRLASSDLLAELEEINGASASASEIQTLQDRLDGLWFVFECQIVREKTDDNVWVLELPLLSGDGTVEIQIRSSLLSLLSQESSDSSMLFAAQLASINEPLAFGGPLRVQLQPESCTLLTSAAHCAFIGLDVGEESPLIEILKTQDTFVRSHDVTAMIAADAVPADDRKAGQ